MEKRIFDYENYKSFISQWIAQNSRGALTRLSEATGVHKTTLSQILRGDKHFTLEQTVKVSKFIQLREVETEYLLILVELGRAGSVELSDILRKQIKERQKANRSLTSRVTRSKELSSEERSIYYSNWIYTAVKSLTAIEQFGQAREMAKHLGIDIRYVHRVLEFLLKTGLCVEKNGRLHPGTQMTHLEADSPLVARHHGNWRIKAMERHPVLAPEEELSYTAPMTLSKSDIARVRTLIADLVQKTDEIVGPSPSEKLFCLNIDWFEVK